MDMLIETLAPMLVVSVALQQFIELLEPALEILLSKHKDWALSLLNGLLALGLTLGLGFRLLEPLGYPQLPVLDGILTALFITGGSKGINDFLKILRYRKQAERQRVDSERNTVQDKIRGGLPVVRRHE